MKILTREAFERARTYLKTQARPVDRALYEYHFENAPAQRVLDELCAYQNPDGGFGQALEPDLRSPVSSPLAARIGLRILKVTGAPADHPMVRNAVRFLLDTFDPGSKTWRIVPPEANAAPHAPWWNQEDGSLERTFDNFVINPRADLLGLLYHYASLVPAAWLEDVTRSLVEAVETFECLGSGGGDALAEVVRLAETPSLPETYRARLIRRLEPVVVRSVSRDPAQWKSYSLEPLKVAASPRSLAAAWLEDVLPANLDYRIDSQSPDGAWDPTWTWFGQYPEVWEQACREWRGEITLHNLLILREYRRLEA